MEAPSCGGNRFRRWAASCRGARGAHVVSSRPQHDTCRLLEEDGRHTGGTLGAALLRIGARMPSSGFAEPEPRTPGKTTQCCQACTLPPCIGHTATQEHQLSPLLIEVIRHGANPDSARW